MANDPVQDKSKLHNRFSEKKNKDFYGVIEGIMRIERAKPIDDVLRRKRRADEIISRVRCVWMKRQFNF